MTESATQPAAEPTTPRPAPIGSGRSEPPATRREILIVYSGFMVVMALAALDQSIVATALPRIVSDLGGVQYLSWVVTSYVLASTSVMPLYGKLSDQYGRKPMVYVAVTIFLIGSALCGLSQSIWQLIFFRALQGLGAGGLVPLSSIVVADLVPRERGRYQGTIGIVYAVASVAGPALGGFITDTWSWHWIFYINLPIGVIALVMITLTLRRANRTMRRSIDYLGAALLAGATTCFLLTLSLGGAELGWTSPGLMAIAGGTLVLATLFFLRERVAPEPVMPLEIFRNRTFLVGTMALAFTFMSLQGASVFFPLFFQFVLGIKASNSGLLTAPMLVGIVISAKSNGRYVYHTGRYRPLQLIGTAVAVLGFCVFAYATAFSMGLYVLEPALLAVGLGLGMVNPNTTVAIQNATDSKHTGAVTAVASFFRSLGGVVGVALSGAILAHGLRTGIAEAQLPAGIDPQVILSGGIVQLLELPPDAYRVVVGIYREALATCFAAGILSTAIAFLGTYLLPEIELKAKGMTRSFK